MRAGRFEPAGTARPNGPSMCIPAPDGGATASCGWGLVSLRIICTPSVLPLGLAEEGQMARGK